MIRVTIPLHPQSGLLLGTLKGLLTTDFKSCPGKHFLAAWIVDQFLLGNLVSCDNNEMFDLINLYREKAVAAVGPVSDPMPLKLK